MGAQFPKFGIGLLTKTLEGRYVFHHKYPCEPFAVSVEATASAVTFDTAPKECLGYAAHLTLNAVEAIKEALPGLGVLQVHLFEFFPKPRRGRTRAD